MPPLDDLLHEAVGDLEVSFNLDRLEQAATRRRRRRIMAWTVSAIVVLVAAIVVVRVGVTDPDHRNVRQVDTVGSVPEFEADATRGSVSVRLFLPARTLKTGTERDGRVVISNGTGHVIRMPGCAPLFLVQLGEPSALKPHCVISTTIPTGQSTYKVYFTARYPDCFTFGGPPGSRTCEPDGLPAPLSPRTYRATLAEDGPTDLPSPPSFTVVVTA